MKFLLAAVNAKYIHSNLAVFSLKAYAEAQPRESRTEVEIAEYTINQPEDLILADLFRRRPDAVGFSCYLWNREAVSRLTADLHQILPEVPVWLGGPEVSFDCEKVLEEMPGVTGIMVGEGERTFDRLLSFYEGRGRLEDIPGLAYRQGERVRLQPPEEPMDLSRVPFPYPDLKEFENRILYYESSRGCPFSCSYCLSSVDKRLRFRDLELVKEELGRFLEARVPQVKFVDRTFNCRKSHAMAIWQFIREHDNGVTNFHFEVGADLLDAEELALLAQMRPGQVQLEIGVQSTNPDTLREIRRSASFEKIRENAEQVRSFGNIHQHLDLIAGLPFEGYDRFGQSFDEVYRLEPDQLQLGFLKVLKGSFLYENRDAYGLRYQSNPVYEVLGTSWLSYGEIIRLKGIEEVVEIYYNSGQFRLTLRYLEHFFPSAFAMYEKLAAFYEETAVPGQSFSRNGRYERMLAFAGAQLPEETERIKALLTCDLYLREPVKSRPAFAGDISGWKEEASSRLRRLWEAEQEDGKKELSWRQFIHDTHMECFAWDPEALARGQEAVPGEYWYWFDYRLRDPKSGNARICRLENEKTGGKGTFQKRGNPI